MACSKTGAVQLCDALIASQADVNLSDKVAENMAYGLFAWLHGVLVRIGLIRIIMLLEKLSLHALNCSPIPCAV